MSDRRKMVGETAKIKFFGASCLILPTDLWLPVPGTLPSFSFQTKLLLNLAESEQHAYPRKSIKINSWLACQGTVWIGGAAIFLGTNLLSYWFRFGDHLFLRSHAEVPRNRVFLRVRGGLGVFLPFPVIHGIFFPPFLGAPESTRQAWVGEHKRENRHLNEKNQFLLSRTLTLAAPVCISSGCVTQSRHTESWKYHSSHVLPAFLYFCAYFLVNALLVFHISGLMNLHVSNAFFSVKSSLFRHIRFLVSNVESEFESTCSSLMRSIQKSPISGVSLWFIYISSNVSCSFCKYCIPYGQSRDSNALAYLSIQSLPFDYNL